MGEAITTQAATGSLEAQRKLRDAYADHLAAMAREHGQDSFAYGSAVIRYEQAARLAISHPDSNAWDGGALASALALAGNLARACGDEASALSLSGEAINLIEILAEGGGPEAELAGAAYNDLIASADPQELDAARTWKREAAKVGGMAGPSPVHDPQPMPAVAGVVQELCTGLLSLPVDEARDRLAQAEAACAHDAGVRATFLFLKADWERRNAQPGNGEAALAECVALFSDLAQSDSPHAAAFAAELQKIVGGLDARDLALVSAHTPAALAVATNEGTA